MERLTVELATGRQAIIEGIDSEAYDVRYDPDGDMYLVYDRRTSEFRGVVDFGPGDTESGHAQEIARRLHRFECDRKCGQADREGKLYQLL